MSNNLALAQVAAAQNQKEVAINAQAGQLDAGLTDKVEVSLTGTTSPLVLSDCPGPALHGPQADRSFFNDPDGHLLEYLAMLPHSPRPEAGVVPYSEWLTNWVREPHQPQGQPDGQKLT